MSTTEIVGRVIAEFIDNVRTGESESRYFPAEPKAKNGSPKRRTKGLPKTATHRRKRRKK